MNKYAVFNKALITLINKSVCEIILLYKNVYKHQLIIELLIKFIFF